VPSKDRFAHHGESWSDRALNRDELHSVLYAKGTERVNLLMHGSTLVAAGAVLALHPRPGVLLDYGCGTGRMLRFFGSKGWSVVGTEITPEMLDKARDFGLPPACTLHLTDGLSIPLADQSVDIVWVSGVLKYSLFDSSSVSRGGTGPDRIAVDEDADGTRDGSGAGSSYASIAREMYRVLRPGGFMVNAEMWVDAAPDVFEPGFERAGFVNREVAVLRRYLGLPERLCEWRAWHRLPPGLVVTAGRVIGALRRRLDDPQRRGGGLRDYLFIWQKPAR
jgi:SAM-dependent methyltransferase